NPPWSTFIFRTLLKNPTFKNKFINAFADQLNTTLLPLNVKTEIDNRINEIDSEMPTYAEKWGWTYEGWLGNNENMKNFAFYRPDVLWPHLTDFFNLNGTQTLQVYAEGASNATIKLNSISLRAFPWTGKYFNNVPVELTAIPPEGYKFVRWERDVTSSNPKITVDINSDKLVKAVFELYQPSEYEGVIINEISYRAVKSEDSEDWIELYNNSTQYIDISRWILQDSEQSHQYLIPENTILSPNGYLVISRDIYEFDEIHPWVYNVIGPFNFGFSGSGECISLFNSRGTLKDKVCYANEYPWPEEANGGGYTLSLSDPNKDNMLGFNWNNSPILNGTPGRENTGTTPVIESQEKISSKLLDCYPNPFNNLLNIPVVLAESQDISIDIYNVNGQKIANVYKGVLSEGFHNLQWFEQTGQTGIFIVKLQIQDGIQIKKILRVK
ncbi:MAG: lamin tail domain-containing protein, partial [Mariniphaga sp.]|nr:lamin tail domain-containing protein [Mariniphaga sp.]